MDEKLIDQLYNRATSLGYKKSRDEFASLVKTDNDVFNDMFSFAKSSGLVSDETQFGSMVGKFQAPYKKKEQSTMVGLPEQMFQPKPQAPTVQATEPELRVSPTPLGRGEKRMLAKSASGFTSEDGLLESAEIDPRLLKGRRQDFVSESTALPKVDVEAIGKQKAYEKEFGDRESYWDNILNSINLGANSFDKMIASIPETAINLLATPGNAIAYLTGLDIATNADKIKEQLGIRNPVLDWLNEEGKRTQEKIEKFNKENYQTSGVAENIANGNYSDAFELIGAGIAQSLPVSLAMMYGGATLTPTQLVGAGTVGFYGENAKQLGEEDPTMPEIEKTLKALSMASAETVFSAIGTGTIGQVYRDLIKKEGADAAKDILQSGLVRSYKKAIEKYGMPVGLVGEGIEEAATQITQNVISNKSPFQGAADAFLIGAGSGAVFTAPISGVKAVNYISDKIEKYDTKVKIENLTKEKGTTLDAMFNVPVADDITVDQLDIANMGKSRDLLLKSLETKMKSGEISENDAKQSLYVFDKVQQVSNAVKDLDVSAEDKATIASLLKKRDDIKVKMQNKDDVLLGREKQQIADINNQINEIILKPKEDAVQEQAAGQVPVQPTTGVSPEVAQGEPKAGPEGVTAEGVTTKEQVTPALTEEEVKEDRDKIVNALKGIGEKTPDKNLLAIRSGLIIHAGDSKIDKLDLGKVKGGVRGIYGKGIYFTDSPYKAADYGGEFTYLDKSKLSIIDTKETINQDFVNSIKETAKKIERAGDIEKSLQYNLFADKLQAEINGERSIDDAWKNIRDRFAVDKTDTWNSLLKDLGYDTIKNGYEYVVFDADKGNAALVKDANSYISEAYYRGDNPKLTKAVEDLLPTQAPVVAKEVVPLGEQQIIKNQKDGQPTKTGPIAGNRLFNEPLKAVAEIANRYYQRVFGTERPKYAGTRKLDEQRAKRIADAYTKMKDDPTNPEVRAAYDALSKETLDQYKDFVDSGFTIEINNEEPYANSQEMIDDLRNNNRIKIFSTEAGFGSTGITEDQRQKNPLLKDSGFKDSKGNTLLVNDVFRAIHDFYGHAELGNSFGPKGEENAWNVHARMFSPLARRAMTTETRGQNSYVNFSGVNERIDKLREEARKLRDKGDEEGARAIVDKIYQEGLFAEQKIGLLPEEFSQIDEKDLGDIDLVQGKPEITVKAQLGVPLSNQTLMEEIESRSAKDERVKAVVAAAKKAIATLKSIIPNAQIYLHEDAEAYKSFAKSLGTSGRSKGLFSIAKDDSGNRIIRIDINLSSANSTTVYHEVAHAVMYKAFGDNKKLFEKFRDQISSVLSKSAVESLNKFASLYKDESSSEEWLVQFAALMADQGRQIPISTFQKIADIVNRLVSKITNGVIVPFKETVGKKEVIEFFNQMSESLRAGKEISISKTEQAAEIKEVSKEQAARPVSELPGYDKLMDDVTNTLIPNAIKRKMTGEEMIKMIKKFVAKSDIYKVADDIQRDELVRQINGMLDEAYKNPPSAQRLLGLIQDPVKITMTEKQLFAKQIMDQAKAAKNVKNVWMKTSQEMASQLKKMAASGRITINQAAAIIRRMSFVNMLDENSVNGFVDYMAKVFKNAEYANQIANVRKLLRNAKRNAETKIGVANELKPLLRQVFAINPSLIPDNVFEKYASLVEMMGERAAVLTLEDATDVRKMAEDIMSSVNTELSLVETLADVFDSYQDKVLDDDGKVMYSDTINKMVDEGKITTSDADILRKYKSTVMPAEPATPMTEQEIADEKKQLEDFVMDSEIDETSLPSRDERDAARKLNALIKTAGVGSLTNTELKNLLKVIANINNGYFPHYAQIMTEKIEAANNNKEVTKFVETAKPLPISEIYARIKKLFVKGKDTIALMTERNPIQYIEQIFGDFKTDTLKKNLFDPIAKAFSNYENEYNKILNEIKDIQNSLSEYFKKEGNAVTMSKYKMMTYMLQLENDSNPGSKEVAPAMDFLNKTINEIESGETNFTERDAEMLREIATKFNDGSGNIDINKLYNSFSAPEKNAIKDLQYINASLSDKAAYTANVIRGQKFTPLNNYIHHRVIAKSSPTDDATGASLVDQFNASRMPSTRAKSLTERTRGAKPISFDVLDSVSFAAKGQLMDYHLTSVIRTGRRTIDAAKKAARKMGKEKRDIMNAIAGAYERAIETVLVNSYVKSTFADDVVRIMSRQGYRAVLAGSSKFMSELLSNISFVMVKGPKYFIEGFKLRDVVMSADGATAMRNLNSKMTNRVYSSDTQSGNFIDRNIMKQAVGVSGSRAKSDVANKLNQIYSRTIKKPINFVEATSDALISTPDKVVMRPAWFGAFSIKFEELTGSKPDLKKIISNDEAYMVDNKEALDEATGFADRETTFVGATDNPFMGILKGTVTKDQSAFSKVFNTFNNYMSRFLIYEYAAARTAVNAMVGNGQLSRSEGAALMAAVATRMVMYSFLINLMGTGLIGMLLGDDDEEEENEKTVTQKLGQAVASGASGLILGRDFGNVTKNLVNYGVEKINKEYLDFLRKGEYDPYKDAIAFSIIGNEKEGQKSDVTKMLLNMTGPLAPTLKTAYFVAERLARPEPKGEEAKERRRKEMSIRLPLEILGNLGMVPLYKDVRKVVLKQIYKDMEEGNTEKKIKGDIKKMLLQGYLSVEDMRRYDPELYESTFGDGGIEDMLLPAESIKKEIDKEIKRLRREVMDDIMDYTPKERGKKNLFYGEETKKKKGKPIKFGGSKKFGE